MADDQQRLQTLSDEYQKVQQELQDNVQSRQKLESQQQENRAVQKEFEGLADDANIYKLVGPVLLKQDRCKTFLDIGEGISLDAHKEISKRVEKQIKDVEDRSDTLRQGIIQLQSAGQQQGQST